jgi:hypothetical protein
LHNQPFWSLSMVSLRADFARLDCSIFEIIPPISMQSSSEEHTLQPLMQVGGSMTMVGVPS